MTRTFGLVAVLIATLIVIYLYVRQVQRVAPAEAPNPRAAVDIAAVKNDLLAIANAERRHFASQGKHASIDELIEGNELAMRSPSRGPYTYSAEVNDEGFCITATYSGPGGSGLPRQLAIDQTMHITSE